jgi:hypothetical protein
VYRDYFTGSLSVADVEYSTEWVSTYLTSDNGSHWVDGPHTFYPYFRYRIFARYREG